MKLLNTYETRDEAESAYAVLTGNKRVASERDDTITVYNLLGTPSWGNFYRISLYNLRELETLLKHRNTWTDLQASRHQELMATVRLISKNFNLPVPDHWK